MNDFLRDEITNDPLGLGYAAMDNVEVERSLLAPIYPVVGKLPIDEFVGVLYDTGVFDVLFDAAETDPVLAKEIRRLQVLKDFGINNLDFANPAVPARLLATGIPAEVVDLLTAKATKMLSRAEVLGVVVNDITVREAR